jgi:hypothetical protein
VGWYLVASNCGTATFTSHLLSTNPVFVRVLAELDLDIDLNSSQRCDKRHGGHGFVQTVDL